MEAGEGENSRRRAGRTQRRRARIAAVQTLYRVALTGDSVERAIRDHFRIQSDTARHMDRGFFVALARGAAKDRGAADALIAGFWPRGGVSSG